MTENEAIHKLEYSKKAYQMLIDEKVNSGIAVGDGVRGEWKAETSLDEVYKSMIEAIDLAIKALEAQPSEDCISRESVDEYITNLLSGYLYDEERTRLEDLSAYIWELPSVQPTRPISRWSRQTNTYHDYYECENCGIGVGLDDVRNFCPNCGAKMQEEDE